MGRVILVGAPDSWRQFACSTLEAAGSPPLCYRPDEVRELDPTSDDLMVLSPQEDHLPSSDLGMLFRVFRRPLRILVVDSHADFKRAGDALRGCAVGYEAIPWNSERLVQLIESYKGEEPPDPYTLDRRFGPWRAA